jgi:hypothetical protein
MSRGPKIVKNGKRVPASTKGKAKKPQPEKKPADDKAKKKAAIARAVWKQTEAHRTTIGKLAALVDTWDEYDAKAEALKEECGGLKGQISEDRAEIRRIVREDGENAEANRLKSLERDVEKREVKLAGKQEERSGAREAMKCAMGDIRKIIRDGPGLFEEKQEDEKPEKCEGCKKPAVTHDSEGVPLCQKCMDALVQEQVLPAGKVKFKEGGDKPAGKGKPASETSPSSPPTASPPAKSTSAPAAPSPNGTHPPSKSTAAPKTPTAPAADLHEALKAVGVRDVLGPEMVIASEALEARSIFTLDDVIRRGMTEVRRTIAPAPAAALLERVKKIRAEMPETVAV